MKKIFQSPVFNWLMILAVALVFVFVLKHRGQENIEDKKIPRSVDSLDLQEQSQPYRVETAATWDDIAPLIDENIEGMEQMLDLICSEPVSPQLTERQQYQLLISLSSMGKRYFG